MAQCVAALDVHTHDLARQIKAGKDTLRALLLNRLLAGAAFIGDSYLRGSADGKQARVLLDQALERQKSVPAAELTTRQNACADEGAKLYLSANVFEQVVVKQLANKRMSKLLATQVGTRRDAVCFSVDACIGGRDNCGWACSGIL